MFSFIIAWCNAVWYCRALYWVLSESFYWVMSVYIPWFVQNNYKANDLENIVYASIALNDH